MKRWEYKCIAKLLNIPPSSSGPETAEMISAWLTELGEDGWNIFDAKIEQQQVSGIIVTVIAKRRWTP